MYKAAIIIVTFKVEFASHKNGRIKNCIEFTMNT